MKTLQFLSAKVLPIFFFLVSFNLIVNAQWDVQLLNTGSNQAFWTIGHFDPATIVAAGNAGTIMRSTDGGSTWNSSIISPTIGYLASSFNPSGIGWIVGDAGTILKTTNSGSTWTAQTSGITTHLGGIYAFDDQNVIAVGGDGKILKTTNGGTSWTIQTILPNPGSLRAVEFLDSQIGFIAGGNLSGSGYTTGGFIYRTSDGGSTWTLVLSDIKLLTAIQVVSNNMAYCVGINGRLFRSTNGGLNWTSISSGTPYWLEALHFFTNAEGFIFGGADYTTTLINYTIDGATWTNIPTSSTDPTTGCTFTDSNTGFLACGSNGTVKTGRILKLTKVLPSQEFTEQTAISLTGVSNSSAEWGDYDNDGDLDILLTGNSGSAYVSKIYRNNGDNTFTEQTSITLTGVSHSSADWGDYDNDGDLDILLAGGTATTRVSKIYRNNGDNTFTEQTSISLTGVDDSDLDWGDYDNDGDLDILLTGTWVSKIYRNNGNNTFTEQSQISLTGVNYGSADWGDYDNDGDLDILLTGDDNSSWISKIYRNNGNNTFTEQTSISLTGVKGSSAAWGDYDNDGDLDILLTGVASSGYVSKLYRNNGNNTFTEQTSISLIGVQASSCAWGDYDNDGDLDIVLTGQSSSSGYVSKIYRNNGNNTFTGQAQIVLTGLWTGSVRWGDYDNDGDLDILLTGYNGSAAISKIYRNNVSVSNTLPTAPTNLSATGDGVNVTLSWNKSTDNETAQNGLRYNLVIGTSPNAVNTMSPMSDRSTGYRRIISLGNTNHQNSWTIKGLMNGTYYWSVQAVDNAFAGSNFSTEQNFTQPVPVELISLSLEVKNNSVNLFWKTATEINSYGFEIERAQNNSDFNKMGFINGAGNSNSPKDYSYTDKNVNCGKYNYRLKMIDVDGTYEYSHVMAIEIQAPQEYALSQNYPNPFNPTTSINFTLTQKELVTLKIYDMLGNEVGTLVNEEKEAGYHEVNFDGSLLSSGTYLYTLRTNNFSESKKLLMIK